MEPEEVQTYTLDVKPSTVGELKNLHLMHKRALRMIFSGMSAVEAAKEVGTSTKAVLTTKNSDLGQRYLAQLQADDEEDADDIHKHVYGKLFKLTNRMDRIAHNDVEEPVPVKEQIAAINSLMDRGGLPVVKEEKKQSFNVDGADCLKAIVDSAATAGVITIEAQETANDNQDRLEKTSEGSTTGGEESAIETPSQA